MSNTTDAYALMAAAETAFRSRDLEAIIELFDEDVEVSFADFAPIVGKASYRDFLEARFRRQLEYRPTTIVEFVGEDVIGASWEATWIDSLTSKEMVGRGCEFVHLRDGKIIKYTVAFNAWPKGSGSLTPII